MAKFISTDWKVSVNGTVLSDHAFDVAIGDEREPIDVSGFSPTRTREYLQGLADQTVTVQFLGDFGSSSVHQTIYPLYTSGSAFPFYVQPDSDAGTSTTNPVYGGTASVFSYPMTGTLNERAEISVEFRPSSNASFAWGTANIT